MKLSKVKNSSKTKLCFFIFSISMLGFLLVFWLGLLLKILIVGRLFKIFSNSVIKSLPYFVLINLASISLGSINIIFSSFESFTSKLICAMYGLLFFSFESMVFAALSNTLNLFENSRILAKLF